MYEVIAYAHGQKSYLSEYLYCERRSWTASWQGSNNCYRQGSHARRDLRTRYPGKLCTESDFAELDITQASVFQSLGVRQYDFGYKSKHWTHTIE